MYFNSGLISCLVFLSLVLSPFTELFSVSYYRSGLWGPRAYHGYTLQTYRRDYPVYPYSYGYPYAGYNRGYDYNYSYPYNNYTYPDLYYMYPTTAKFFGYPYSSYRHPRSYNHLYQQYYLVPGR